MKEPVNIMGVVAFPNENGKRDCRFIDPHYNELFTVPDGGNVVLTYIDGTKKVLPCTYIDDYHVKVGSGVYHICEFAEQMCGSGTVYQPERPTGKEKYGIYEIYQISDLKTAEYCHDLNAAPAKLSLSKAYEMVYRNEALKTCSQWNTLSNRQIKALLSVPALSSEISLRIDGTKEQRRFFLGILSQIADDELSKVTQEKRQLRRKQLLKSVPPQL